MNGVYVFIMCGNNKILSHDKINLLLAIVMRSAVIMKIRRKVKDEIEIFGMEIHLRSQGRGEKLLGNDWMHIEFLHHLAHFFLIG